VTSEEERQFTVIIDEILSSADLNTISAKTIRKGIQAKVDYDINEKKVLGNELLGASRDLGRTDTGAPLESHHRSDHAAI
jgi:upstream activation factor subunit UAF30